MPTMLLLNRLIKRSACFVSVLLMVLVGSSVFAGQSCTWNIKVGSRAAIDLNGKLLKVDRPLLAKLRVADEAALLPAAIVGEGGGQMRWLVLRTPSRLRGTADFCGAGHEDRLVLLQSNAARVTALGEFLAQSCLSSVSMDVDQLKELLDALHQNPKTGDLLFQQSVSSETGSSRREVAIFVRGGALRVETRKLEVGE